MAKIVNCWNEWDPLKRVVLGTARGTQIPAPEPAWHYNNVNGGFPFGEYGPFPEDMVNRACEQQDEFARVMEKKGVIVDRVVPHESMLKVQAISTPDWTQLNQRGISNPRDLFLPVGNEIIEATCSLRSRWFEYLALRPLFEKWFEEDPDFIWTSAPRPRLTDESYVKNYYYDYDNTWDDAKKAEMQRKGQFHLTEKEPLWDAADAARAGKDIFLQPSAVTNRKGFDWVKRYLTRRGIRVHKIEFDTSVSNFYRPWHIDCSIDLVRPGMAIICPGKPPMTPEALELFKINDWELIPAVEPVYHWTDKLTLCNTVLGQGQNGPNWISMNMLSLGPKTVCVDANEKPFCEQFDKLGFEVLPITYDAVFRFGGMLHCTTLDVYREGDCEDYFPNQIAGY